MASRLSSSAKRSRVVAPSGTVAQRKTAASAAMGSVVTKSAITGRVVTKSVAGSTSSKSVTAGSGRSARTK
ncbi:hypothetical protein ACPEEZ_00575 [Frigoribacterium sp. 2-23]|uniref:hypothetical protein n=1 Tax=Frigoribacterium sp. 2-23 TaxID=3415006 RepID=UPI003C6F24AA